MDIGTKGTAWDYAVDICTYKPAKYVMWSDCILKARTIFREPGMTSALFLHFMDNVKEKMIQNVISYCVRVSSTASIPGQAYYLRFDLEIIFRGNVIKYTCLGHIEHFKNILISYKSMNLINILSNSVFFGKLHKPMVHYGAYPYRTRI